MTATIPDPEIIYQDAHLLVLDKPTGLPTTSPEPDGDCLVARAQRLDPHAPRLHPSSRLDAEVTGLVLFARTRLATQALLDARREGRYGRCYAGLSAAPLVPAVGRIEAAIALDPRDPRKRRALPLPAPIAASERSGPRKRPSKQEASAKPAASRYRVAGVAEQAALLWLYPETGRTHQLRVHAAYAGQPLLGDRHYGGPARVVLDNGRVVRIPRVMLHCTWVRVPAVVGTAQLEFRSPLPADLRTAFIALGGNEALLDTPPPKAPRFDDGFDDGD